jgi:biopolymer transport protein ExbB
MSLKTFLFVLIILLCGSYLSPSFFGDSLAIYAEEEAKSGNTTTMLDMINAGGVIGYVIMLISVIMFGFALTFFMNLRRDKLVPPDVLGEIEVLFEDEDYEGAMELCEAQPCFLTNVIASALPKIALGFDVMIENMRAVQEEEAVKFQQKISVLSLIGAIAPMLGLLGTVTGMIGAFNQIAGSSTAPKPSELAGGISMALVTTCQGLIVAIPAICFYFFLRNIVVKSALEVAAISEELMERFRPAAE